MKSGIKKSAKLIIKSGKWHMTEGIERPNQEKIREMETFKDLGILEADTIKNTVMKEEI